MLNRLIRGAATLLVIVAILPPVIGVLMPIVLRSVGDAFRIARVPTFSAGAWAVLLGLFLAGLALRALRWIRDRDPRAARARDTSLQRARLSVRRPAEGVPLAHRRPDPPPDPDPALPMGGD